MKNLSVLLCLMTLSLPSCTRSESAARAPENSSTSPSAAAATPITSAGASAPALQTGLRAAASALADAHFFHFTYTQEMKKYDGGKRHRNTYVGDANLEKSAYHYTMTTDGSDDQKFAGEWIVVTSGGGYKMTGYHKEGATWVKYTNDDAQKSPDIAFLGIDSFRRTLTNASLVVSDDEPDKNPKLVGSETLDGRAVDHYKVNAGGPLLPGPYDIFVDKGTQSIVRADGVSDGSDYSLSPSHIGEKVTIEEPSV
jgi:hypothetical protein